MTDPDSRLFAKKVYKLTNQNRERTGVPARAARVGWWMRPAQSSTKACDGFAEVSLKLNSGPVATAPGSDTDPD